MVVTWSIEACGIWRRVDEPDPGPKGVNVRGQSARGHCCRSGSVRFRREHGTPTGLTEADALTKDEFVREVADAGCDAPSECLVLQAYTGSGGLDEDRPATTNLLLTILSCLSLLVWVYGAGYGEAKRSEPTRQRTRGGAGSRRLHVLPSARKARDKASQGR